MDRGPFTSDEVEVTLFVPCYNEAENIASTLDKIVASCTLVGCSYEIIVIDDASKDGTPDVVRSYHRRHRLVPLRLVVNPANRGLAHNFTEAARLGCGRYYRLVCGDDVEPIATQVAILSKRGQADIVLPYPLHVANKTRFRRALSWTYTRLANLASGHHLPYWNGCPLLLRTDVISHQLAAYGFGFQARQLADLLRQGRSYVPVGCTYNERQHGRSRAVTYKNFVSVGRTLLAILSARLPGNKTRAMPRTELPRTAAPKERVAS
jgi:glycosyltransferase involved in cell wall biosynthesis